jgi:hypothetical protein
MTRYPNMQYRLRTLLILLAVGPPLVAGTWLLFTNYRVRFTNGAIVIDDPPPHSKERQLLDQMDKVNSLLKSERKLPAEEPVIGYDVLDK